MSVIILKNGEECFVDEEDYHILSSGKWYLDQDGYVIGRFVGDRKMYRMHRFIISAPSKSQVDHINHNKLDNRKVNLRLATSSQNNANKKKNIDKHTSNYKCVYKRKSSNKNQWEVNLRIAKEKKRIGTFSNEIAAANAYNYYAIQEYGEFAILNDVPYMEKEEWLSFIVKPSSKYKGVSFNKATNSWKAFVIIDKKTKHIGLFNIEEDARDAVLKFKGLI